MISIEYIKEKMSQLVNLFPNIKCSYEFDGFDNTHTIEVLPSDFFQKSKSFYRISLEIDKEFISKFPFECLFFIDDKDMMPVKNIIHETIGRDYETNPSYSIVNSQTICNLSYGRTPLFFTKQISHSLLEDAFAISKVTAGHEVFLGLKDIGIDNIMLGESNFAMAA